MGARGTLVRRFELSREHWIAVGAALAALGGLAAMRMLLTPDPHGFGTHEQLGLPPCRAIDWFGIPCPGCGVTTSVTWFVHGHPWQSFATQPLGFLIALGLALALPAALGATALGHDLGPALRGLLSRRVWGVALAVAAVAWAYKIAVVLAG